MAQCGALVGFDIRVRCFGEIVHGKRPVTRTKVFPATDPALDLDTWAIAVRKLAAGAEAPRACEERS